MSYRTPQDRMGRTAYFNKGAIPREIVRRGGTSPLRALLTGPLKFPLRLSHQGRQTKRIRDGEIKTEHRIDQWRNAASDTVKSS